MIRTIFFALFIGTFLFLAIITHSEGAMMACQTQQHVTVEWCVLQATR